MSAPANKLSVAVWPQSACVRITGKANFTTSVDFKRLLLDLQKSGHEWFVLDLSNCLLMDSTFLGVLTGIGFDTATSHNGHLEPHVELWNPNPRISELIDNLGVGHLFRIVRGDTPDTNYHEVSKDGSVTRAELTRTCLEAHRTLMNVNPENVTKFKDVETYFAEKLEGEKPEDQSNSGPATK